METLEIVIGIVFIFLLLSLLGTIVQEFYTTSTSLRGKILLDGLTTLLEMKYKEDYQKEGQYQKPGYQKNYEPAPEKHRFKFSGFLASFFSSKDKNTSSAGRKDPDFKSLILDSKAYNKLKGRYFFNLIESLPSYLSAEQVMAIYQEALTKTTYQAKTGESKENSACIRRKGEGDSCQNWSNDLQVLCKAALEEKEVSPMELEMAQHKIAIDFEQFMDRVSGQFKRRLQSSLLVIGLIVSVAFNADTIRIYRNLASNPENLKAVMALADDFANNSRMGNYIVSADDNSLAPASTDNVGKTLNEINSQLSSLIQNEIQHVRSPLGLGWDAPPAQAAYISGGNFFWLIKKIPGWLLTTLAISLGAPFWFDLLSRLINIRNSGRRPESQRQVVSPVIPIPSISGGAPAEKNGPGLTAP